MLVLRRAIRRELFLQLFLYAGLLSFGLFFSWYFFDSNALLCFVGLFFSFLGFFYCIRSLQHWAVHRHPIIQLIYEEPKQVVWVYTVVTQRMPYGFVLSNYGLLYLKLLNGEDLCVSIPARRLRLVSHCLNRLLPHATFGYSPNKEQLYRINPEMLVQ